MTVTVDKATQARRDEATRAFIRRMHAAWHAARGLECKTLACEHAWYPR